MNIIVTLLGLSQHRLSILQRFSPPNSGLKVLLSPCKAFSLAPFSGQRLPPLLLRISATGSTLFLFVLVS